MRWRVARGGFTLIELLVVLSIIAIVASVVVISLNRDVSPPDLMPANVVPLAAVLRAAQRAAVDSGRPTHLVIDPTTLRYQIDLAGQDSVFALGRIALNGGVALAADSIRAQWWFDPGGSAMGDSVRVSGGGLGPAIVAINPFTGQPTVRSW